MRFKCVAKRWRSLISDLISDPSFVKSHLQRLKARDLIPSQRIFKINPFETIDYEALDGGEEDRVVVSHSIERCYAPSVVGSCNGLICILDPCIFLIYNPTTREYRKVPGSDLVGEVELFYGFGYDSRSDDYKIVEAVTGGKKWEVAIFSLKSRSWTKTIHIHLQEETHLSVSRQGVYWEGALHWCVLGSIIDDRVVSGRLTERTVIISFDLSEERFHQELPVPEVDVGTTLVGLGIHGASLFIYSSGHGPRLEAWIMDEHGRGGSWTKWFSVDCIPAFGSSNTTLGMVPLVYTRSGKIVLRIDMDRIILFNSEDNSWKDYPIRRDEDGVIDDIYLETLVVIYLETLVSPYLDGEASRI